MNMSCETKRKIVSLDDGVYMIKGFKVCDDDSYEELNDKVFKADTNGELKDISNMGDPSTALFCVIGHNEPNKFFTVKSIVQIDDENVTEDDESCFVQHIPHGFDTILRVMIG